MKLSIKAGVLAAVAAAAVAVPLAGAASASAATVPGAVKAVVHSAQHLDTANVSGSATIDSPNGPVWAYDNLSDQFTVVPTGANTYAVTIDSTGSFKGFADPMHGTALDSAGSVKGTIEYDVFSTTPPSAKALPSQEPDSTSTGVMIGQLFGQTDGQSIFAPHAGDDHVTGGGAYNFSYQNGSYVQSYDPITNPAGTITGDVSGH